MDTPLLDDLTEEDAPPDQNRSSLFVVLLTMMIVAVLAMAVAGGFYWGSKSEKVVATGLQPSAVDIGFARDMALHHQQGVTMAAYTRDNSSDPAIANVAYDIESTQTAQLGEMTGWLDTWGKTVYDAPTHLMRWMGAAHASHVVDGLMPGMATPAQLKRLETLHGKALDIYFLQLMIRHHQGALAMAAYAAQHANEPYVRNLAGHIDAAQSSEIIQMEQLLRQRGGTTLKAPVT